LNPQPQGEVLQESSSLVWKVVAVMILMLACIAAGYGWLQHDAAQQLAAEREDLRTSLAQAKSQEDALTVKVNALTAAQAQEQAARAQQEEAARVQAETVRSEQFVPQTIVEEPRHKARPAVAHHRTPVDDPRWKQFQQQLGDQQNALAESQKELAKHQELITQTQANLDQTKSDLTTNLQSARTELGSDIARNHAEVVALQKKGERTYYEFGFEKSKTFHHTGPISVALHKADSKHGYCDLEMVVDDKNVTRKHVNLFESISLYPEGYPQPVEVVINHIDKDSIRGYVSEPKYRTPEQAVAAGPAPTATSAAVNPPEPAPASDGKLEHRDPPAATHQAP